MLFRSSNKFKNYKWEYNRLYFNKPDYSKEDSYYKGIDGLSIINTRTDDLDYDTLFNLRNNIEKEVREKNA